MEEINDNQLLTEDIVKRFGFKYYDNDPYGNFEWGEDPFSYYQKEGILLSESYEDGKFRNGEAQIATLGELKALYLNRTGKELKPVYNEVDLDKFMKSEREREESNYYKNMKLWGFHLNRLKGADPSIADTTKIRKQAAEIVATLEAANPAPYEYAVNLNSYYADNLKHFIKEFKTLLD